MGQVILPGGAAKTATAQITVTPSGLAYTAELWLGPNSTTKVATSGVKNLTSTGGAQSQPFAITLPTAGGLYHVYLDILYGGNPFGAFQGTDDVVIPGASVGSLSLNMVSPANSVQAVSIPVTVTPSGQAYTTEIWLGASTAGPKLATTGVKSATSTGAAQTISGSLTMPATSGVYKVVIDVKIGTALIGQFISNTDEVIPGVQVGPITWG